MIRATLSTLTYDVLGSVALDLLATTRWGRSERRVNRTRSQARRILAEMFGLFMQEPDVLPSEWYARSRDRDAAGRARMVCDYIAGMTDRYASEEHRRLFHLDTWT